MTVEQYMRGVGGGAGMVRDDHWMAGCFANGCLEAYFGKGTHQPFGTLAALRPVGGVGRDGLDSDEVEQAVEALGKVLVGAFENGGEIGHGNASCMRGRPGP